MTARNTTEKELRSAAQPCHLAGRLGLRGCGGKHPECAAVQRRERRAEAASKRAAGHTKLKQIDASIRSDIDLKSRRGRRRLKAQAYRAEAQSSEAQRSGRSDPLMTRRFRSTRSAALSGRL